MLRLVSISARGLKGSLGNNQPLAPTTLVVGANATGKTTIPDAVLLLALGRRSTWPKRKGEGAYDGILRASSGDEIEITGEFSDGTTVTRRWWRYVQKSGKDAGAVKTKSDVAISTYRGKDKAGRERAVRDFFGLPAGQQARQDAEAALDVRAFLGLSDDARRGAILRLSAAQVEEAWPRVRVEEALPAQFRDMLASWDAKSEGSADFVSRIAGEARDEANGVAADLRQARAAEREIEDGIEAVEPAVVGQLRARLREREQAAVDVATAATRRVEEVRARVDAAEAAQRREDRRLREVESAQRELKRLRAQSGPDDTQIGKLRAALRDVDQELTVLRQAAQDARDRMDAGVPEPAATPAPAPPRPVDRTALDALIRDQDALRDVPAVDTDAVLAAVADSWDTVACPHCAGDATEAAVAFLRDRLASLAGEADDARRRREHIQALVRAERAAVDEREARRWADHRDALARHEAARAAREQDIARFRRDWQEAEDTVRAVDRSRDDTLRALRTAESAGPDDQRISEVEGRLRALEQGEDVPDVADLRAGLQEAERIAGEEKATAQQATDEAAAELERVEHRLARWTHACEIREKAAGLDEELAEARSAYDLLGPRGLLGDVLRTVLDPFTDGVNAFLDGMDLGSFRVGLEDARGNETFAPGLETASGWTPLETLSGSERTVVGAGLSVALARLAGLPWRPVLVDEVQDLDGPTYRDRRYRFLRQVVDLVDAGEVSQALVLGCPDTVEAPDSVLVVRLEDAR